MPTDEARDKRKVGDCYLDTDDLFTIVRVQEKKVFDIFLWKAFPFASSEPLGSESPTTAKG